MAVPLCQVADPIGDQLLAEMTKRIVNRASEGYGENLRQLTKTRFGSSYQRQFLWKRNTSIIYQRSYRRVQAIAWQSD
ncbi:hypothetical protein H6F98_00195 [Microcoleus sp. FACHB-SPT15]|uniref:hypothetical protein n=1 Tax=Microcoleus sp. FACHB-SPT15 TaxID=2692830 RepID=UPI001780252C|nr:hypothetical protein [Microcoleus sp. FACHB-SPT15]MBD1803899.1 hypothetical protein [Microcoleus sp. FACHB-SPT15]